MHDGRFKKLSEVLNHYTSGIHQSKTLAPQLKTGTAFTSNERVDIIAFLLTLSDKEFVFNPKFQYPK
jgi:cytochrome c peroxidase